MFKENIIKEGFKSQIFLIFLIGTVGNPESKLQIPGLVPVDYVSFF